MNGVQTRLKCKPNVKQCKRLVFPARSALFNHNILNTKAISHFQANHILIRFVFPPLITNGFALKNWGVEEDEKPVETALPMNELFEDVSNRNFTIKDKSSEVYIQGIGDPYWRK